MAGRARMRRPVLPKGARITLTLVVTVVAFGIALLVGAAPEGALGVSGFVFGLATYLLTELGSARPGKRIWYIGQEDAVFNDNIRRGLEANLDPALRHVPELPTHDVSDVLGWQRGLLNSSKAASFDAVVILPASDDPQLWNLLADLADKGASVVVIDIEPRWEVFHSRGVPPPVFVSSDLAEGGRLAGNLIADELAARPGSLALVAVGPSWSPAGAGRSAWILYALAQRTLLPRIRTLELAGWQTDSASQVLSAEIDAALGSSGTAELVVFCGDDRIMSALSRTFSDHPTWRNRVWLIGYDGTTDTAGRYLAQQERDHCLGTVDTQPVAQGQDAAKALNEAYHHPARAARRRRSVPPAAITPSSWG